MRKLKRVSRNSNIGDNTAIDLGRRTKNKIIVFHDFFSKQNNRALNENQLYRPVDMGQWLAIPSRRVQQEVWYNW
jgi:hypothetical protein